MHHNDPPEKAIQLLLLEDDHMLARALQLYLGAPQFQLRVAHSIAAARELVELGESFGVLIVSEYLREGSGCDFVRELRSHGLDPGVVVMSGGGSVPLERSVQLAKPFTLDQLIVAIEQALPVR